MMCHPNRRASRRMALSFPLLLTLSMSFVVALAFAADDRHTRHGLVVVGKIGWPEDDGSCAYGSPVT
jgi:hypothetical protein